MAHDNSFLKKKSVNLFYKVIMPGIMAILLLGIPAFVSRPMFMGSRFIDISTRIILCTWFCMGFIRLPDLAEKYRIYPNIKWEKKDVSRLGRFYYSCLAILFGVGVIAVTWWMTNTFLPIFKDVSLIFAIVNGIIYAVPLVLQYQIFKP